MTLLDRYLTRQCVIAIVTVVGVLAALTLLFALIEELDEGNANYGFSHALQYLLLTMPRRIEELLSYGVFIGLLLALGNLAEGGELTAIRAAGVSPQRIILALLPTLGICLAVNFALSEFLSPAGERAGMQSKQQALLGQPIGNSAAPFITPKDGIWLRRRLASGSEFAHIGGIDRQGQLANVHVYEVNALNQLIASRQADSGNFDAESVHWELQNVATTALNDRTIESFSEATWVWANPVNPEQLATQAFSDPRKMTVVQIWRYLSRGEQHRIASVPFELTFWQKVLTPLTYLSMALMALAVVIGPLRHTGIGQRLTIGLFIGLGFKYLQDLFAPMAAVFNVPSVLAVMIPALIYLAVAQRIIRNNA